MTEYAIETYNLTKKFASRIFTRPYHIETSVQSPTVFFYDLFYRFRRARVREIVAVDHVNLSVKRGEFFGLLGPNGAGKSTLLRLLCGLTLPTEGDVKVLGYDVVKDAEKVLEVVNYVPGTFTGGILMHHALTAKQNLERAADIFNAPKNKVDELLKFVRLENYANVRVGVFSSGMVARLVLCFSLMKEAPIYLMDEPMAGISFELVKELSSYLKNHLNRELGATIVYATNHLNEAAMMCDRVAVMDKGRVIAVDNIQNLIKALGRKEIIEIELINMSSKLIEELKFIDYVDVVRSEFKRPEIGSGSLRVHTVDSRISLPRIIDTIVRHGGKVCYLKIVEPTLEDVFTYLVGGEGNNDAY